VASMAQGKVPEKNINVFKPPPHRQPNLFSLCLGVMKRSIIIRLMILTVKPHWGIDPASRTEWARIGQANAHPRA
jgi:hypothetical protein